MWLLLPLMLVFSLHTSGESEGVLNRLLAPGPLIGGHKQLEKMDCLKCHDAGKGIPDSKCLDCHKEIAPFVREKRGFHGLTTESCMTCHKDHKGRDYDTVKVDQKTFEHGKLTGYELEGKHAEIKCQECHREKRTKRYLRPQDPIYLGKAKSCVSCHKKDDVHHYVGPYAAKDCGSCHGLKSWTQNLKFDHDKDTKFKIEGAHGALDCADCHQNDPRNKKRWQYQWPKIKTQKCLSCHQDYHKTNVSPKYRGGDCLKCHNQNDWQMKSFKHDVTGYKLNDRHAEIKCIDCHKQVSKTDPPPKGYRWSGLKQDCLSCHKDFHLFGPIKSSKLGNLNQCQKCHDEKDWKSIHRFTHNEHTRYVIDGAHNELNCTNCHLPDVARSSRASDAGKKLNITRPGPGGALGRYHWQNLETKTCNACHVNPHVGQFKKELLAQKCSTCHTTESWMSMKTGKGFDHSKTRFPLTEAHAKAKCASCHIVGGKQVFKFKSEQMKFCIDCHQNVHKQQFSSKFSEQACAQCHTTKNFTERLSFDHSKTRYALEGGHIKVRCEECHKPTSSRMNLVYPNISKNDQSKGRWSFRSIYLFPRLNESKCMTCHKDYHKGQLGNDCQKCHTVNDWKKTIFDHNTMSRYPLVDKHAVVACSKCHAGTKENIKYKPLGMLCINCHKDVHKGNFGKQCQECHTIRDWKITKDFHKNFALSGVHYSLECAECHKDGRKLSGLSQQCIACHAKDDVHSGTLPNCKECHRQHFWESTGFKHSLTRFPLRGAHRTLECLDCHNKGGSQSTYQGLNSQCQSCHSNDFRGASSTRAVSAHQGESIASDCSRCHRQQFSFQGTN